MPRDNASGRHTRLRIANAAARLIAVDGIHDFALAKKKAARQIGAPETRNLPTNEEVEAALGAYQQLYQADEQELRLGHLRKRAVEMMRELQRFNPQLSGAVLEGSAARYCEIDLHLFTDSAKEVELFLLNHGLDYTPRQRRVYRGVEQCIIPVFAITTDDADFSISVFASIDLRLRLRNTLQGRPFRHAGLKAVLAMQDQEKPASRSDGEEPGQPT
jgi:hypothetical protein